MNNIRAENYVQSRISLYIAAFFLPVLMFFAVCAYLGLLPFGTQTALDLDLPNQYLCYFGYLPSIAAGENDLVYTLSKTLGGDMISMLAYYFLSPLNLAFLFTSLEKLPLVLTCVIAAKLGLCGLSFAVCTCKHSTDKSVLIFSTAHALMSYNITYASNLMWLDAVYLLPVIVLGMERMIDGRSPLLYSVALALCLFINYYTGYMVCIFCVLWFAFRLLAAEKGSVNVTRTLSHFVLSSLLAGGLAAVILVPTFLSLSGTKASVNSDWTSLALVYTPRDLVRKLFSCSVMANGEKNIAPNIYCGILTLAFLPLYFFNGKISRRERLASAGLVAIVLVSMGLCGTYIIWHAFALPAGFPQRSAFVIGFVLCTLAYRAYCNVDGVGKKCLAVLCAGTLLVGVFGAVFTAFLSDVSMIVDVALILLAFILSICVGKRVPRRVAALIFAAIQFGTLFENAVFLRRHPHSSSLPLDYETYLSETAPVETAVEAIKAYDTGIYRVAESKHGDTYASAVNAPMKYAYNGVSHFDSTEKTEVKQFMANLGYISYKNYWASYGSGSTVAADSLLGIEYVYSAAEEHAGYSRMPADGELNIYKNVYALPLAFVADADVLTSGMLSPNVFENQNSAYSAVLGHSVSILNPVTGADESLDNLRGNTYNEVAVYERVDYNNPCALNYTVTPATDGVVYIYAVFPEDNSTVEFETADIYVNGEPVDTLGGIYDRGVKSLGYFKSGESFELSLVPRANIYLMRDMYLYSEDSEVLSDAVGEINESADKVAFEKLSSSKLRWTGIVREDDKLLMLTLPYESAWQVLVDGEKTELKPALGVLSAVELSSGEHTVELRYIPHGLYLGTALTLISLLALVSCLLYRRRKKAKSK